MMSHHRIRLNQLIDRTSNGCSAIANAFSFELEVISEKARIDTHGKDC